MVKIEITLKDEQGKKLKQLPSKEIEIGNYHLDEIEKAVEKLRKEMLPELTRYLVEEGQRQFTEEKKKKVGLNVMVATLSQLRLFMVTSASLYRSILLKEIVVIIFS